ncbi:MAG: hypothetical protein V4692_05040 [Bdellovibrionota bacterium]
MKRRPKSVRPSSVHIVGEDFHAKAPPGWFNLERIQLEEARATDPETKRDLNLILANFRMMRAEGNELMIAGVDDAKALMTITKIEGATIEKSKLGSDKYCEAIAKTMMEAGQKLESAETSAVRKGIDSCSIRSTSSNGRKYAGIIMFGKTKPYLLMATVDKGREIPVDSLQALVDSWYLK